MTILVTGGSGYIASSLVNALKKDYDVVSISRQDFNLTSYQAMRDFFHNKYFDTVIHCAVQGGSRLRIDSYKDMDANLTMYYNLLQCRPHYKKLIHFGSGAEFNNPESPYGLSKRIIAKSISEIDSFYNIRIFGVFDENELPTRFIKANMLRYINKEPMLVQNKKMSFFYMQDLIKLVKYYINNNSAELVKECNCAYLTSSSLLDIANAINQLGGYEVPIHRDDQVVSDYVSYHSVPYELDYIGLYRGIKIMYDNILYKHSS